MSLQAAAVLKMYLEQCQTGGTSHVPLRPGALDRLRELRSPGSSRAAFPQAGRVPVGSRPDVGREQVREAEPPPAAQTLRRVLEGAPQMEREPAARMMVRRESAPVALPAALEVPGGTKAERLAALAQMAEHSPEARALSTLRETMVFATGTPDAEIMFIGEAPGAEEERMREPFVGPAGQKLTGIIKAMGLSREQVYISNICKFRPAMPNQGSSNRAPTVEEMRCCLPYVLTEIQIVQPRVIVALGGTASTGLGIKGAVSALRGRFMEVGGIPVMVTFHPSYILREERNERGGLEAKRQVWQDMLKVMERCGLPISEKQRAYFQKG